ncbi:SH3 domain-containing protein [Quisquiliibacterium transsilvanicum]|uniref:SH3-like domain-containing protein n=1 Tax=Quisquiliibacterium transsilvanicum TaxID=1549638 RepID=A0A7W8HL82_9BURK|nr:SH3 domain-containing protein [Quisquiliibacterium transsilvanicum]MBB5273165.1 SH3-like domain-containing protein [Quisquiliibacterium transsilvanicum]
MIRAAVACFGLALAAAASAAEYGSVGGSGAVIYDGPSANAQKIFVAPPGMPVELLSLINKWVKVRDQTGQSFWIERGDISPKRTVVTTRVASVRSAPRDDASLSFRVRKGVLLELIGGTPGSGWAQVRHADGDTGFVRANEVWGFQ